MGSEEHAAIWWVRRDFRLADNPALRTAIDDCEAVLPLFVLDPTLLAPPAPPRADGWRQPLTVSIMTCAIQLGQGSAYCAVIPLRSFRDSRGPKTFSRYISAPTSARTGGLGTSALRRR